MKIRHPIRSESLPRLSSADLPLRLSLSGHDATLRWLGPEDTSRLVELFAENCETDTREHTVAAGVRMTLDEAERLVCLDQQRDAVLGIFEEFDRDQRLVGLGWYCVEPNTCSANASFVMHGQRRALGFENYLLQALIGIAGERKLDRVVVHVHQNDEWMFGILRAAGATLRKLHNSSLWESVLRVRGAEGTETAHVIPVTSENSWVRDAAARTLLKFEQASEVLGHLPTP